jgi:hypothetical protein
MIIHPARGARHRTPRALHGALASRRPAQIYAPRVRKRAKSHHIMNGMQRTPGDSSGGSSRRSARGRHARVVRSDSRLDERDVRPAAARPTADELTGRGHGHDRGYRADEAGSPNTARSELYYVVYVLHYIMY